VALLKHGGRRLKAELARRADDWATGGGSSRQLVDALADLYGQGYAELALGLHQAGWRSEGSGLLNSVVDTLHGRRAAAAAAAGRPPPPRGDTQLAVAALNQALLAEPLFGPRMRASAGIPPAAAATDRAQRRWWADLLDDLVGPATGPRGGAP
jgi:hypothetical protein